MTDSSIPLIDLAELDGEALHCALRSACSEWGFFQVLNHGIPRDVLDDTLARMREFFGLPPSQKRAIQRTATNAWGYYDRELTKNRRDMKEIFDVGPSIDHGPLAGNHPQWPATLPAFRVSLEAFFAESRSLGLRLLRTIVESLDAAPDAVLGQFSSADTSFLRLNHYPPCASAAPPETPLGGEGDFGINHHTDAGALTVLLQDEQPGLQVYRAGRWALVQPLAGALVINIGDIVQVWSNDRYRAALHRVLASRDAHRFSAPLFLNPSIDTVYAPLPGSCDETNPPRYRPIHWGEFRAARAAGDYADIGLEVQIDDFRLEPTLPGDRAGG